MEFDLLHAGYPNAEKSHAPRWQLPTHKVCQNHSPG